MHEKGEPERSVEEILDEVGITYEGPRPDPDTCVWCRAATFHGLVVSSNGSTQVKIFCRREPQKHPALRAQDVPRDTASLPIVRDNRTDKNPCVICGSTETERHHWAPGAVFGFKEAERWPTAYLCPLHHREWHQMMGIGQDHLADSFDRVAIELNMLRDELRRNWRSS